MNEDEFKKQQLQNSLEQQRKDEEDKINRSAAMVGKVSMDDKIAKSKASFVMPAYLLPPTPKKPPAPSPDASPDANSGSNPNETNSKSGSLDMAKDKKEDGDEGSPNSKNKKDPNRKPKRLYKHGKPDLPDVSELAEITELECGCKCDACIDYYKKCVVMRDQLYAAQSSLRSEKNAMKETMEMIKEYEIENKQKFRDADISLVAEKGKTKKTLEDIAIERKVHLDVVYKLHKKEEEFRQLEAENLRCLSSISQMQQKVEKLQIEKLQLAEKLESVNKTNVNAFTEMHKYELELARLEELNNIFRCQLADIDKVSGGQIQKMMFDQHTNPHNQMMSKSILKGVQSRGNPMLSRSEQRDGGPVMSAGLGMNSGLRQSMSSQSSLQKVALSNLDVNMNRAMHNDLVTNVNRAMNEKPSLLMQFSKGYK